MALPKLPKRRTVSRRDMLRLSAGATLGLGMAPLSCLVQHANAMVYLPKRERMWDTWMLYHHGTFYLFHLSVEASSPPETPWNGYSLATSKDGVHWKEEGCVYRDSAPIGSGYVYRSPFFEQDGRFLMQITRNGNRAFSFAESSDLFHWKELGDKYDFVRDLRWYSAKGRWDMMHVIERPGGGCYGYWTANPIGAIGFGFGESEDGVRWKALPPPLIDWDGVELPLGNIEVVSVDKIGDRYYALVHNSYGSYLGDGSGAYVLVADNPAGPYRADREAYRLFSTNAPSWQHFGMWCCTCCRTPDGVLVNNHHITRGPQKGPVDTKRPFWSAPDAKVYLAPLKRAVVDGNRHLRLGYWEGNDKLKARALSAEFDFDQTAGAAKWRSFSNGVEATGSWFDSAAQPASSIPRYSVLMMQNKFDIREGVVLEGAMNIPPRNGGVGVFIEEEGGMQGTAILNQISNSANGQIKALLFIGMLNKRNQKMDIDDRIATGIDVRKAKFRLLLRGSLLEFYVNDFLARAYSMPERTYSGRLGLVVADADARFEHLGAWSMELGDA